MDTEKQTELFKVPAHGNVDHSNILHDFKKVSFAFKGRAYKIINDGVNCEQGFTFIALVKCDFMH